MLIFWYLLISFIFYPSFVLFVMVKEDTIAATARRYCHIVEKNNSVFYSYLYFCEGSHDSVERLDRKVWFTEVRQAFALCKILIFSCIWLGLKLKRTRA